MAAVLAQLSSEVKYSLVDALLDLGADRPWRPTHGSARRRHGLRRPADSAAAVHRPRTAGIDEAETPADKPELGGVGRLPARAC